MSFRKVELSDCGTWLSGGTPTKSNDDYWGGEIPWISAKSLHDFYIRDSDDRVTEVGARNGTKKVDAGTVLILVRGMSLTEEIRVGVTKRPVVFNQDVKAIQPAEGVDALFLANAIRASEPRLLSLVDEASHGTGRLQTSTLEQFQIPLPSLPVQRRIADILGALDDKIELNRRMNRTLEEMAQTLYRHWFVEFGPFQDRAFKDTEELGSIPEGWEVKSIGDVVKMKGGSTPKTSVDEYWDGGDITWFTPTDLTSANRIYLTESDRQITEEGLNSCSTNYIPPYSLMMTSRATVGVVAFNRTRACTNQGFINIMPQDGVSRFQVYFWIDQMMPEIMARADGSTYPEISQRDFKPLPIPVAPPEDVEAYVERSQELFDLIENNILESETLAETRDYLLPNLISGEVKVDAAEEAVASTT
jgi:type I restriction enzyme S subunit